MEDLTKQQIILLTLFVSFVTSMATGIVAVSLLDQSPRGVTQTINRIVERTIERVVDPNSTSTVRTAAVGNVLLVSNTPASAVAKVSKGIVRLKSKSTSEVLGLGIVLSKEGIVVTDKIATGASDVVAVFPDGKEFPVQVVQSQILGDIVFLAAIVPRDYVLYPVTHNVISSGDDSSLQLGTPLLAIGGKDSNTLHEGLVGKVPVSAQDVIETTVSSKNILVGSPLFTLEGNVIGMKTSSLFSENSFYSLSNLKSIIPVISR